VSASKVRPAFSNARLLQRGPVFFGDGLLLIAVDHRIPFDLIPVRWVFERLEGIRGCFLAFEETCEERKAGLRAFEVG